MSVEFDVLIISLHKNFEFLQILREDCQIRNAQQMRLILRLAAVCILICFLIVFIQLKLLDFNCINKQCWPTFDYESEQSTIGISANQRGKKLPNALIIGAKKGGTRALIDFLQLNPQIVAAKREVHFFDDDSLYSKGLEWYIEQMPIANDNQVIFKTNIDFKL